MNAIRRFLLRDSWSRRNLLFLVFAVLLSRALLSGTVMLDPDAPVGSFGLEICSGSGPMFPVGASPSTAMPMRMDGMRMDGMRMDGMQMDGMDGMSMRKMSVSDGAMSARPDAAKLAPMSSPHTTMNDSGDRDTNGICPFNAAFLVAIVSLACLSLFLGLVAISRYWGVPGPVRHITLIPHSRPLSRAPPSFA